MARVVIPVRVSEAEAAEIDGARGAVERGPWLRRVALAAVREPARKHAVTQPAATAKPRPGKCPHPERRVLKGLCNACGNYVGVKA